MYEVMRQLKLLDVVRKGLRPSAVAAQSWVDIIRGPTQEHQEARKRNKWSLGDFLYIRTPNTGQFNPLFHTVVEFRPIVNRVVARQSTDWLAASAQFSPNAPKRWV